MLKLFPIFITILIISWNKSSSIGHEQDLLKKYCTFTSDTSYSNVDSIGKLFPNHVFDNCLVVGCGQSSHGSRENFEIQKLIFENLVEKHGCRTFIIEGCYSSILIVNEYVQKGIGTKDSVMKSLGFWTWNTEEVWDLIKWVKKFNEHKNEKEQILFLGNDMQDMPSCAKATLRFISKNSPESVKEVTELVHPFLNDTLFWKTKNTQELLTDYDKRIRRIKELVDRILPSSKDSNFINFSLDKRNGIMMEQSLFIKRGTFAHSYISRDSLMAENIKWIIKSNFVNGLVFVWAHNDHIGIKEYKFQGKYPYHSMGNCLRNFYLEKYYSIGVDFISGLVNARNSHLSKKMSFSDPIPFAVCGIEKHSLNYHITKLNVGITFLNLDVAKLDSELVNSRIFNKDASIHDIGAGIFSSKNFAVFNYIDLKQEFNALIFFPHSTPTQIITNNN